MIPLRYVLIINHKYECNIQRSSSINSLLQLRTNIKANTKIVPVTALIRNATCSRLLLYDVLTVMSYVDVE
jgi:hypothetical protein